MAAKSRFSIEAVISMVDKVSGPMKKASSSVAGFNSKIQNQFKSADISAKRINKSINKVGGPIAKAGLAGIAVGAGLVARQFVQFDDAIFAASSKFKGLDITTKAGMKTMEQLRKTARKVGADTKFNAVEAAQGLDFLAMAGFNTEQAMASLPGVVSLATVANTDLATATDIASDTLGAFNLMTEDSAQLQKNLARVNDVSAKTTTRFNTTLTGLFEAIKKGGPTFTAGGQSIESFSALIGVMANAGVKGEESGTQLRNVMLRLADPTKEAQAVIDKLNIKIQDSQGNFRDVIDILSDFETGLKGMGTAQRSAALSTVFGARSVTGINILLAEGADKLKGYREELLNSGGAAQKMASIIEQSMGNKIKALTSALTEFGFKIIESFAGDGKKGIDVLTEGIRSIDPTPIVRLLQIGVKLLGILYDLAPAILVVVAAVKIYTAIQWLLNAALTANPIGLFIAALASLIVVGVLIIQNWKTIKSVFWETMLWIQNKITSFIGWIMKIRKTISGFIGGITDFFTGNEARAELNQTRNTNITGMASPESRNITNNTNTTKTGNVNVNIGNAPKGTTVEKKGSFLSGFGLNIGTETF